MIEEIKMLEAELKKEVLEVGDVNLKIKKLMALHISNVRFICAVVDSLPLDIQDLIREKIGCGVRETFNA